MSLAVVGVAFDNKRGPTRRFEIAMCVPGETVELRREPKNPADSRAIAVYSARGLQIGYITAERAPMIGPLLDSMTAVFQQADTFGAVIRACFDGELPVLPPPSARPSRPAASKSDWPPPDPTDDFVDPF